jgi:hypothetical protein
MRKLVLILIGLIAAVTLFRTLDSIKPEEDQQHIVLPQVPVSTP